MLRETSVIVAAGLALGFALALPSTQVLSQFLYGLSPTDPATIGLATLCLLAAALLAGYLPARRAARLDPQLALRRE
jgi:ABC-type antimicrobial peptide transport system permease subunit